MRARVAVFVFSLAAGCAQLLDLDAYDDAPPASTTAASSSGSSSAGVGGTGGGPDDIVWAKRWGGPEQQRLAGFAVDNDDRIVLAGNHDGAFAFGPSSLPHAGGGDFFVAKVDAFGEEMWASAWGDNQPQYALAITRKLVTEELTYVTGRFGGTINFGRATLTASDETNLDGFVARFGENGAPATAFPFFGIGAEYPAPITVAPLTGQNLLITGHTTEQMGIAGSTVLTSGEKRGFLARIYAGAGNDWLAQLGGAGTQTPLGIAADGNGRCVLVGNFTGTLQVGSSPTAIGGFDAFVTSHTPGTTMTAQWLAHFGSTGDEHAERVAIADNGDVLVVGSFSGTLTVGPTTLVAAGNDPDLWLARLSGSDGSVLWANVLSAGGLAIPRALTFDLASGRLWLGGDFDGQLTVGAEVLESKKGTDIFVVALDAATGAPFDARSYGEDPDAEAGDQSLAGLALRSDGNVVLGGSFESEIVFGSTTLQSSGGSDIFIAVGWR